MLIFFAFTIQNMVGQTVISNGGDELSSSNAKISFTIGETLIGDFIKSNENISQGFHSNPIFLVSDIKNITKEITVEIYPNPTTAVLNVQCLDLKNNETLNLHILSPNGQVINTFQLAEPISMFDLTELAKGNYFIQIYKFTEIIFTSKLIKNE